MPVWWCYPGDQDAAPYDIALVRAETPQEACGAFGERFPSPCVHRLTSPRLLADLRGLAAGVVCARSVHRLPSNYDQFERSVGWNYRAMDAAGFDVS